MTRKTIFNKLKKEFINNPEFVEENIDGLYKIVCMDYYIELAEPETLPRQHYKYQLYLECSEGLGNIDVFSLYKKEEDYKWFIHHLKNAGFNLEWLEDNGE